MEQNLQKHLLKGKEMQRGYWEEEESPLREGMLCQGVLNEQETGKRERSSLHSALLAFLNPLCKQLHASPMGSRELWLYSILISHPAAQTKIKQICTISPEMISMFIFDSGTQAAQASSLQPQALLTSGAAAWDGSCSPDFCL